MTKNGRLQQIIVVFCISSMLVFSSATRAGELSFAQSCQSILTRVNNFIFKRPWNPIEELQITTQELSLLKAWVEKHNYSFYQAPYFLEEHVLLLFSELPIALRDKLMSKNLKQLTPQEFERRMSNLKSWVNSGDYQIRNPLVDGLALVYHRSYSWQDAKVRERIEKRMHELKNNEQKSKYFLNEIQARIYEAQRVGLLLNSKTAEYRIQVKDGYIQVPDGPRYKIESRSEDGTLIVKIPKDRVLRTQDYLNGQIILQYRAEASRGKGFVLDGDMVADGRYFILDGHHRLAASEDYIYGMLRPHEDGHFYAQTHMQILRFYAHWSTIPVAEREEILKQAIGSPIAAIREAYYRYMALEHL